MDARSTQAAKAQALAWQRAGRHADAVALLEEVARVVPDDYSARYRLVEALVACDRTDEAIAHLRSILAADPKQLQPLRLLGALLFQLGRFEEATRVFAQVVTLRSRSFEAIDALAKCHLAMGATLESIRVIERAQHDGVRHRSLDRTLARAYHKSGRLDEARALLEPEIHWDAPDAESLSILAQVYERQRRYEEAVKIAERAHGISVSEGVPARVMARVERARGDLASSRRRLESLYAMPLSDEARAHVCMELGQVLDEQGEYESAMTMFEEGHAAFETHNPSLRADMDSYIARIERGMTGVTAEEVASWPTEPPDDGLRAPVFLVGFPRSGTTLFERMLGGVPGVFTSDEAPMLAETVNTRLKSGRDRGVDAMTIASWVRGLNEREVRELRAHYWASANEHLGEQAGCELLIDKHPMNTPLLAMVRRLFPDAKVLTILRDPRDAVLSAYMQDMVPSRAMLHFRTLGTAASLYDSMMRLYRTDRGRLGLNTHEPRYEDLLDDPEPTARALCDFLRVPWSDSMLGFASREGQRPSGVNPYSTGRELFRSSYGRWRRYETRIADVEAVLRDHIRVFGYSD